MIRITATTLNPTATGTFTIDNAARSIDHGPGQRPGDRFMISPPRSAT
jgi:hypothetical protein